MHMKTWHKAAMSAAVSVLTGGALIGPATAQPVAHQTGAATYTARTTESSSPAISAHPASVSALSSTTGLRNAATRRCVDDSFAYGLRSFTCNKQAFQTFDFNEKSYGVYALKNRATGRCVDDSFAYGLRPFDCNGGAWQNWEVLHYPTAVKLLRNKATGRCLDDSSAGLRSFSCHPWGDANVGYQSFSPLPL